MNALSALLDALVTPQQPSAPALLDHRGRVMTYGELAQRVRACSGAFDRAGLAPGAAVAFGIRQDADGITWLLGALRAGVMVVVLDPGLAPATLIDRCRVAGVEAVVTDGLVATVLHTRLGRSLAARRGRALPDPMALARTHWATGANLGRVKRLDRLAAGDAPRPLDPDAPALVLFTSGTTGAPRGVVHSPASLAATMTMAERFVDLAPTDRVLGNGLHLVAPALLAGAAVVLPPPRGGDAPLAEMTRRLAVSHVSLPLHRALGWAAAGGGVSPSLRMVMLGSAPVRNVALRELVERVHSARVSIAYGMTEHLLVASLPAAERLDHDERRGDLVGHPLPGVDVRVADDGEVHVAGPALARGYLGEPGALTDVATGDLGYLDGAGRLVLVGRRKEMIIRDGQNIYPGLYEASLADAADLETAVMVGVPGPDGDETVALFAVAKAGDDVAAARDRLLDVVSGPSSPVDAHARPDTVLGIAAVPRSGRSGKPDRRELARIAAARSGIPLDDDPALPVAD